MEQQRYTLKDINFVAEANYTDINSKIVGFQIENNMVLSMDIADRLSVIINKMLADYYAETCKRLEPSDFHVTMSIEMNTSTNKVIINTYIFDSADMILHTEIDVETLRDYGRMKKCFFDMLACITLDRIRELQKAAGLKSGYVI
ncbi:hypothetical protein [Wujia sp.]|uniref:hypothetical protein n=1 Tax=Wujia sp. TaxID=2944172 RepID=UPI003F80E2B7